MPRRNRFYLVVGLLAAVTLANPQAKADSMDSILPATKTWSLTFEDTFTGPSRAPDGSLGNASGDDLNEQVWTYTDGEYLPGFIESSRHRANIVVENGLARLITRREQTTNPASGEVFEWTSAHMYTRTFNQEFGYFEARMRIANADGQNNAFWLTKVDDSGNAPLELDISEAHYPTYTTANLHDRTVTPKHDSGSGNIDTGVNIGETFNLYGLEWTPDVIRWYFNGTVVREFVPGSDFATNKGNYPLGVRFSTALLPSSWDGTPQKDNEGNWLLDGQSMDVDWVRVYEATGTVDPPSPPAGEDFEDFDGNPDQNGIDDQLGTSLDAIRGLDGLRVEGFEDRDLDEGTDTSDGVSTLSSADGSGGEVNFTFTYGHQDAEPQRHFDDGSGAPDPTGLDYRLKGFGVLDPGGDPLTLEIESDVLLEALGIVALSDDSRGAYDISGLATLDDGSTVDLGTVRVGDQTGSSDDTFLGHVDTTGLGIRSLLLTASNPSATLYPGFDELAFSVPEPASLLLLAFGGCAGLRWRPRGRNRRSA